MHSEVSHWWHFREAHHSEQGNDGIAHGKRKASASAGRILTTNFTHVSLEACCFLPHISDLKEFVHGGQGNGGMGYASPEDSTNDIIPDVMANYGADACAALARTSATPLDDSGWGFMQRKDRQQSGKAADEVDAVRMVGLQARRQFEGCGCAVPNH